MQDMNKPQELSDEQLADVTGGGGPASISSAAITDRFGTDMSIPDMMLQIQMERSNMLGTQVQSQMTQMQQRNDWLRDANTALGVLRANEPAASGDAERDYGTFTDHDGIQQSVHGWMTANGIAIETAGNDTKGGRADFDQAIGNLTTSIDTTSSQSQMDMVRLQGLMDKRNQAYDMMTNTLSKTGKQLDGIIGNMR